MTEQTSSKLLPRELFIHVSKTNKDIEAVHRTQVVGVESVELLEWKATGTTDNPASTGAYTNEVVWLKCEFPESMGLRHSGLPQKQFLSPTPDQIGKIMLNVEKPQIVLQDNTKTPARSTEISGNLRSNPTIVVTGSSNPQSYFTSCRFTLHANPTDSTEITYTNLYLWLRVYTNVWQ